MSRAFVKEDDGSRPEVLPEIPVSSAPNLVTARGLRLIEARIAATEAELAQAPDAAHAARLRRDLRYWTLRHATARPTAPDPADPAVQFGSRVSYRAEDGSDTHAGPDRRGRGRPDRGPHRLDRPGRPRPDRRRRRQLGHGPASRPAGRAGSAVGGDPRRSKLTICPASARRSTRTHTGCAYSVHGLCMPSAAAFRPGAPRPGPRRAAPAPSPRCPRRSSPRPHTSSPGCPAG